MPGKKAPTEKAGYVRIGISPADDALLDQLADRGFKGALDKKDVGRLCVEFALSHYGQMMDWFKKRGLDVLKDRLD
jgi:hypothetical protein